MVVIGTVSRKKCPLSQDMDPGGRYLIREDNHISLVLF